MLEALDGFVDVQGGRWLDVLPLTGLYTEEIASRYPEVDLTFAEMTDQVFEFVQDRAPRPLRHELYPDAFHEGPEGYDVMSLIFRMEGYPRAQRREVLTHDAAANQGRRANSSWPSSTGVPTTARCAGCGGGSAHKGVEYALAPDPSLGPFKAATPGEIRADLQATGWRVRDRRHFFAIPPADEIEFSRRPQGPQGQARRPDAHASQPSATTRRARSGPRRPRPRLGHRSGLSRTAYRIRWPLRV